MLLSENLAKRGIALDSVKALSVPQPMLSSFSSPENASFAKHFGRIGDMISVGASLDKRMKMW